MLWKCLISLWLAVLVACYPYDPSDTMLESILPNGTFEAFYTQRAYGEGNGPARAPHGHGSFYSARSPALVDVKNAPAYGYRFDGYRRFNFD